MGDSMMTGRARLQAGRQFNGIGGLVTLAASVPNLTTLRVSNAALKSETLPPRIKILQWGANDTTKGTFYVTPKTVEKLAANQRSLGFERVALDYNHCSIAGTADYEELITKGRPPLIFGYGRPKAIPGDGVWLEDMEWTPLGVECAKQFEDLSPAVGDERGQVIFVHSVALTPNGCVHGLSFFSAIEGRAKPLTGRARAVAAFARETAARDANGLARLSAAGSVAPVSAGAGRDDRRKSIRRTVSRDATKAWNAEQLRRPGGRSPAEYAQFQSSIDQAVDAAVATSGGEGA